MCRYARFKAPPSVDSAENVVLLSSSREGSVSRVVFRRPARTADTDLDVDLHGNGGPEDGCPYVFYGRGGNVDAGGNMGYHPQTPVRFGRVCFGICADAGPTDVPRESESFNLFN